MKITREEIEKLKELCGKASPAPWEKQSYMNYFGWSVHSEGRGCIAERWYPSSVEIYPEGQEMCSNMELIAASRTAVPALIERIEELENALVLLVSNTRLALIDDKEAENNIANAIKIMEQTK